MRGNNGQGRSVDGRSIFSNEASGDGQAPGSGSESGRNSRGAASVVGAAAEASNRGLEFPESTDRPDSTTARGQEWSAGGRFLIARTDGFGRAGSRRGLS